MRKCACHMLSVVRSAACVLIITVVECGRRGTLSHAQARASRCSDVAPGEQPFARQTQTNHTAHTCSGTNMREAEEDAIPARSDGKPEVWVLNMSLANTIARTPRASTLAISTFRPGLSGNSPDQAASSTRLPKHSALPPRPPPAPKPRTLRQNRRALQSWLRNTTAQRPTLTSTSRNSSVGSREHITRRF